MGRRHQGSITVFTVLSLSLVVGCLLALLEGARSYEIRAIASLRAQMAVEAPFANYNSCLWENYQLLGNNLGEMASITTFAAGSGYDEDTGGTNLFMLKLKDVEIQEYTLLTDGGGTAYINAVSAYMSKNFLYEVAKGIYNQYEAIKELVENHSPNGTEIEDALENLENIELESRGGTGQNPLEVIQKLQKTQLLELVVEDTDALSQLEYDLAEAVSHRKLEVGKQSDFEEVDWLDRVFLQQYLLTYLTDYTNQTENRGLRYELEYLIGGKNNDIENLREVANQLLIIREAANLAYLFSDVEKMEIAQGLAVVLAGVTVNPVIIEGVKVGILVAWAFGESVLDVRALLEDKKVPLIKSQDTWTLSIENLGEVSSNYMTAKESDYGISYKNYLGVLLLFQKEKTLACRAMDVQEITLQKEVGNVLLDQLVVRAKVKIFYEYAPVFYSFPEFSLEGSGNHELVITESYGYY